VGAPARNLSKLAGLVIHHPVNRGSRIRKNALAILDKDNERHYF
jgi:hypothetical protein